MLFTALKGSVASCCIASLQGFWNDEDTKIQAEVLVMVVKIS